MTQVDARPPSLLARYGGARPAAPDWYARAAADVPERRMIQVAGAPIELLVWPGRDAAAAPAPAVPGLLFIHGGWAHADWWSFIAPFFGERRCAAFSLSGMGGSGHRDVYDHDLYMAEAFAAIEAAGLGAKTVLVAHSFGGGVASHIAARAGERLGGAVIVDAAVWPPGRRWTGRLEGRPARVRPSFEAQLQRFRLMPPQPCDNDFLVDHVARASIRPAPEGGELGWIWRFDPKFWERLDLSAREPTQEAELAAARCPLAFIVGDRSAIVPPDVLAYTLEHAPSGTVATVVPDSGHHVMLDQPLALVAALRALLASGWPARAGGGESSR